MDKNDENFQCIQLKWHRTEGEMEVLAPASEYGIVPVDALIKLLHTVHRKRIIDAIDSLDERIISHFLVYDGTESCKNNRFFLVQFEEFENDL